MKGAMMGLYNGSARTVPEMLPIFREWFPEFAGTADPRVEFFLGCARVIFGGCEVATIWLAAHLVAEANSLGTGAEGADTNLDSAGGAPTQSAKVGELSAQFFNIGSKPLDSKYTTTLYGRNFISLRNACPAYRAVAGVGGSKGLGGGWCGN